MNRIRHKLKYLRDAFACLGTCFEKFKRVLAGKCFCLFGRDLSIVTEVYFVCNEGKHHLFRIDVVFDLPHPITDTVECRPVRAVKYNYDSVGLAVVRARQRLKPLLTGCVPDL